MVAVLCLLVLLAQEPDPIQKALAAMDAGKPAEAVALLEPLAQKDDKNLALLFNLALAYALNNQDARSIETYESVLKIDGNLYEAKLNFAQVLMRANRNAEARAQLESALAQKPDAAKPLSLLAEAMVRMGDGAEAEKLTAKLVEKQPADKLAWLLRARALQLQKRPAEAAEAFEKGGDLISAAAVREGLAMDTLAAGKPAEAAALLEQILAAAPTTAVRYALAVAYSRDHHPDKSIPLLEKALESEPRNFDIRMFYGRLLRDQLKYENAAPQFSEAVKLRPDSAEAWSEFTGMLILLKQYPQALQGLEKVRSMQGETAGYWWFRALIYDATRQPKLALPSYERFLEMSQDKSPDEEFKARQRVRILKKVVSK